MSRHTKICTGSRVAAATCSGLTIAWMALGVAQEKDEGQVDTEHTEQLIEEVVATGRAWRLPRPEVDEWRSVEPTTSAPRVRMELGYDPERERELRNDNPLREIDPDGVRSATVIRFRF